MSIRFPLVLALLVPLIAAGCASTSSLPAQLGERVELVGTLEGPAKLGDFVIVDDGEQVYLRDPATMPEPAPYGRRVRVVGTLEHFAAPADAGCGDGCEQADVPSHWFVRGAVVTPAR